MRRWALFMGLTIPVVLAIRTGAAEIELLEPVPFQRQVVDALRRLEKSPYQTLRAQFERGREPTEKDVKSMRAGRCYFSDRPMQAVATLLMSETQSDDGPAFRGPQFRKILPLIAKKMPPSFFDKMSPETVQTVQELTRRYRNDVAFPVCANASLRSFIPRSMTIQARSYELRRKGPYLLMKVTCEDNGGCFNPNQTWVYYYEDEDLAYCYFFRP